MAQFLNEFGPIIYLGSFNGFFTRVDSYRFKEAIIFYRNEDTIHADDNDTIQEENADDKSGDDCFYCDKHCITRKGRKIFCIRSKNKARILQRIKKYATEMNDLQMLLKIQAENENGTKHLTYHNRPVILVNFQTLKPKRKQITRRLFAIFTKKHLKDYFNTSKRKLLIIKEFSI